MLLSVEKFAVTRIGPSFSKHGDAPVTINGLAIDYATSIRYAVIRRGKYFRLSINEAKVAFYRAVNILCTKTKCKFDYS